MAHRSSPPRDYAAEYRRKEARARAEGFGSYWAKRKARATQADRSVYQGKAA
jgi:hypothetical protein